MKFRRCIIFLTQDSYSKVIEGRRGRAEARQHAGDVPECPGTKKGCISKISFPAIFRSLALNDQKMLQKCSKSSKSALFHGSDGNRTLCKIKLLRLWGDLTPSLVNIFWIGKKFWQGELELFRLSTTLPGRKPLLDTRLRGRSSLETVKSLFFFANAWAETWIWLWPYSGISYYFSFGNLFAYGHFTSYQ